MHTITRVHAYKYAWNSRNITIANIHRITQAHAFRSHACIHIHTYVWLVLGFSSIQSAYSFCCLYTQPKKDKYQRKVTLTLRDAAKGRDPNTWWENQLFPKPRTRKVTHSRATAASESGQLGILWGEPKTGHLMHFQILSSWFSYRLASMQVPGHLWLLPISRNIGVVHFLGH